MFDEAKFPHNLDQEMIKASFYHSDKKRIVWKHGPNRPFFLYNLSSENY